VNVISIHSRRVRSGGLYLFLEAEGHAEDSALHRALSALAEQGLTPVVCGSYPRYR
jgi:prephenate dehydratase